MSDLRSVYQAVGSKDKKLLICSREHGFSGNYGHIDLVLGRNAPQEIFPHIHNWIVDH